MVISADEVRAELAALWPGLEHIWLRNMRYVRPAPAELDLALAGCRVDLPVYPGFNECENFALFVHARIKERRVRQAAAGNVEQMYNWAFGDMICEKKGLLGTVVHTACICIAADGVKIIEPMAQNRCAPADPDRYRVFFVNLM